MADSLRALADAIAASGLQPASFELMRAAPAVPPLIQTGHLLGVSMVMASALVWQLRLTGVVFLRQPIPEMRARLQGWFWAGLALLLLTALPMLFARPHRYLLNPVFQIKMGLLLLAILLSVVLWRRLSDAGLAWRLFAAQTALLWLVTALAGRWIAYSDYLFWPS